MISIEFKIVRTGSNRFVLSKKSNIFNTFIDIDKGTESRVLRTLFTMMDPDVQILLTYEEPEGGKPWNSSSDVG